MPSPSLLTSPHPSPQANPSLADWSRQITAMAEFRTYREAFHQVAGMPLWFVPVNAVRGATSQPASKDGPHNDFCAKLNVGAHSCHACSEIHQKLVGECCSDEPAKTLTCFAGFQETSVPIYFGKHLVGFLRTGQTLKERPTERAYEAAMSVLRADAYYTSATEEEWHRLFFNTSVVDESRYEALVSMLTFFASQLSAELERIATAAPGGDLPETVRKAANFLRSHFQEEVSLDELAKVSGVSSHHLCTVFKQATGQTIVNYLNRERIFQAKKQLSRRYARVSDVALDVGFGSLSQFNRCFQKFCGESPSDFRKRVLN